MKLTIVTSEPYIPIKKQYAKIVFFAKTISICMILCAEHKSGSNKKIFLVGPWT
jgi:hypothetical protein